MKTESDYLVKNAKMVFNHFNELITKKCLISAHFGDRNTSFLTTITGLDSKNKVINLDCGPSEKLDEQLLSSSKVLFRTEVDGIKVSFSGKNIKKINTDGDWVLSMPIPDTIFWLQRRQFYRVKIPLSHNHSYCRLTLKIDDETETETFQLYDLSITGFSFLNSNPRWSLIAVGFVIKNNVEIRANSLDARDKIGCLLHPLTPSFETSIQRYMQEIELQQKITD